MFFIENVVDELENGRWFVRVEMGFTSARNTATRFRLRWQHWEKCCLYLFNKHLLRNIERTNLPLANVFHDIANDVYHQRRQQLKPYSISTLPDDEPVYLNKLITAKGMWKRSSQIVG